MSNLVLYEQEGERDAEGRLSPGSRPCSSILSSSASVTCPVLFIISQWTQFSKAEPRSLSNF